MKKSTMALLLQACLIPAAWAQQAPVGKLVVALDDVGNGEAIPSKFAYCMPDGKGQASDGGNTNPAITWSGEPDGTKSFALLVVDHDVPVNFTLANQADKIIPVDFPRQNFYHWVLTDIPPDVKHMAEGEDSHGITQGGKRPGRVDTGVDGQNDYATFGKGLGGGYDGPCPPWNDERMHHYHFIVYALDVSSLNLTVPFNGKQAENAMAGHILAKGEVTVSYTDNQKMVGK